MLDLLDDFFDLNAASPSQPGQLHQEDVNRRRLGDASQRLRELEQRYERMKLVTAALWQLLKVHNGLTDEDLKRYIEKVDLADGKLDGKIDRKGSAMDCPAPVAIAASSSPQASVHGAAIARRAATLLTRFEPH